MDSNLNNKMEANLNNKMVDNLYNKVEDKKRLLRKKIETLESRILRLSGLIHYKKSK